MKLRKKIIVLFMVLVLLVTLMSCSKDYLQEYKDAEQKTSQIQKGQESIEFKVENEFNSEGLTLEKIKSLNYFKTIDMELQITYDDIQNKVIARNYSNFGGMGFDSVFYKNRDKMFLKMPMIGKYLDLENMEINTSDNEENGQVKSFDEYKDYVSKEDIKKIQEKWNQILNEDDVLKGESTVLSTPDGEIKTTHFMIDLSEEQIKELVDFSVDIFLSKESFEELITIQNNNLSKEEINTAYKQMKNNINKINFNDFSSDIYIDIDGYIIREDISCNIEFKDEDNNKLNSTKFSLEINRWSIEKDQQFNFPILTEENTLNNDNLNQGVPFMFEGVLDTKIEEGGK